ncbi:hypothetical protein CNY89_02115 [Amaricoccus sp. HAR-UPW-R2A-40]|nr:hypothetical protein CNY89_02115 [Amaricoccus sp. HAR-UPW-R2A-40]
MSGLGMIDAEAEDFSDALAVPLRPHRLRKVSDVVALLKHGGAWDDLDWLVLTAQDSEDASLRNLRNPAQGLTPVGGPTFAADRGWLGNGADAYLGGGDVYADLELTGWAGPAGRTAMRRVQSPHVSDRFVAFYAGRNLTPGSVALIDNALARYLDALG